MAFSLVLDQIVIARNAGALYNTAVGSENMAILVNQADTNPDLLLNEVYQASIGDASPDSVAAALIANLHIPADGVELATNFIVARLNSVPVAARGAEINHMLTLFAGLTADPLFGAAATAFNDQVANAVAYASVPGNSDQPFDAISPPAVTPVTPVPPGRVPGGVFTLTAPDLLGAGGTDTFSPTSTEPGYKTTVNDDIFRAVFYLPATDGTLGSSDYIDAGDGNDTLIIYDGGVSINDVTPLLAGVEALPTLISVETINITDGLISGSGAAGGATLNLKDSSGINAINVTNTGATTTTINDAALSTTFGTGLSTAAGAIDINFLDSTAGANDTLKFALGDNDANTATVTSTADTGTIEAIAVAANGSHSGASVTGHNVADQVVFSAADFNTVKTLTVTGDGNSDITLESDALTTVTATSANGNNTYLVDGIHDKTVATGSGDDIITTGAGNDTVNSGAGDDNISAGAGANTYNGGLGADTYNGAGTDTFIVQTSTIEDLGFDSVSALGFTSGTDTLSFFGGPAGSGTNYDEVIGTGNGFADNLNTASGELAADHALRYVAVQDADGADTYVFFDGNGDHALTTDGSDFAVLLVGIDIGGIAAADILAG